MNFPSVPSIINYVVLFGDVLPDWHGQHLHVMTRTLLRDLEEVSKRFFRHLPNSKPAEIVSLGREWVVDIMRILAKYLPLQDEQPAPARPGTLAAAREDVGRYQLPSKPEPQKIAPPGGKHPPSLFDPNPTAGPNGLALPGLDPQEAMRNLLDARKRQNLDNAIKENLIQQSQEMSGNDIEKLLRFHKIVASAATQDRQWEDTRSDLAEALCRATAFGEGPITGQITEGHHVEMLIAGEYYGGQLFDRPIVPRAEIASDNSLLSEADTLYRRLRKLIFPNREPVSSAQRFVTNGGLDAARLPIAECSEAVYKRYRMEEGEDSRGRPIILIVNDGSGSVGPHQMRLMKILSMAWIKASLKRRIKIMAGVYHHAPVEGKSGAGHPIVEWLYHPEKTPNLTPSDALQSIAGLPEHGSGGQADAISLKFMLDEAVRLAGGKNIYLIHIADFKWCPSFQNARAASRKRPRDAEQEVRKFYENAYKDLGGRLHATMVGLDALKPESYVDLVDKVIIVPKDELCNYTAVADRVGTYVAKCVRERRTNKKLIKE